MIRRRFLPVFRLLLMSFLLTTSNSFAENIQKQTIRLATTTSTDNSGLLNSFKEQGITLLLASHDPLHFCSLIDRHLHLSEGRLVIIEERKLMPIPSSQTDSNLRSIA
jgi:ABC-type thiamine transport system ATPase subunit